MRSTLAVLSLVACAIVIGCARNQPPLTPAAPAGPAVGMVGESLSFLVVTTDPESDSVKYRVDWGDAISDWSRFLASAESCTVGHAWSIRDTYAIRVQASDVHDKLSEWSLDHVISIESLCRR